VTSEREVSEAEVTLAARPAVLASIPRGGHVVLEASAGTGKTYALEHLVVDLLLDRGIPVERMLVVTFTEKATEELRERVRAKLRQLAGGKAPAPGPGDEAWRIDEPSRRTLAAAVARFDAATLSTIHGFCQRVLTEHSFAHKRLFEQRLVDGRETFARGFRAVLSRQLGSGGELREPLLAWLRDGGSLQRLQELVADSLRQRGELTPRWEPDALHAAAVDFAAACDDFLLARALTAAGVPARERADHDPRPAIAAFLADVDAAAFGAALRDWGRARPKGRGEHLARWLALRGGLVALATGGDAAAARALAAFDALGERAAPPLAALVGRLRAAVGEWLQAQKRSLGLYDFDDMLLHVREAVAGPRADAGLVAALRERWDVALIDEFQDTDEVQWDIFRSLFFDTGGGHRLFLIGDPKQAIYGFRNADVETYLAARDEVEAAGGTVVRLSDNHRSTPALIAACNHVFSGGFFSGRLADPQPARPGNAALAFESAAGRPLSPVVVVELRRDGAPPKAAESRSGFASFVAEEARRLVASGARFGPAGADRPLRYADLMVLARSRAGAKEIADALRAASVPHMLYGQEGLLATPEAEHVRRVLAAVASPEDSPARLASFLTPFFGVPLAELAACRELPETHPLVARILGWAELGERRRYAALFRGMLRESGLVRRLLATREGERELTNYQHVFDLLLAEAHRSPTDLGELTMRLASWIGERSAPPGWESDVQRLEAAREAVQVLTMHKAKGLQAPVVFVAGLGGSPPVAGESLRVYHRGGERRLHLGKEPMGDVAAAIAVEERQETERLYYVALTRARGRLYLPHARSRKGSPWKLVEDRLDEAVGSAVAGFEMREVECAGIDVGDASGPLDWSPDPALLARVPDPAGDLAVLRRSRAGRLLTSYTRIRRRESAAAEAGDLAEEPSAPVVPLAPGELPGGKATGIFLHRVLELLDPAGARAAEDVAQWLARPDVDEVVRGVAAELAVPSLLLPAAGRLVWNALRTPLSLPGLELSRGICEAERRAVEMELVFPIPEAWHPRLGDTALEGDAIGDGPVFRAGRGFVQGVVDLVFEHGGRTFFVDWKSDRLPAWDAPAIAAHVDDHYRLQARLYALGVLRLLELRGPDDHERRFGGLLYCFLRGMGPGGAGVHFARPAWDELRGWERELHERQDWGAA